MAIRSIYILLFILVNTLYVHSQPGPIGGGLRISGLYNMDSKPIKLDNNIKFRKFIVSDHPTCSGIFEYYTPYSDSICDLSLLGNPIAHYAEANKEHVLSYPGWQRLVIFNMSDTMVVDFIGILGAFSFEGIDSLIFRKGHYYIYLDNYRNKRQDPLATKIPTIEDKAGKIDSEFLNDEKIKNISLLSKAYLIINGALKGNAESDLFLVLSRTKSLSEELDAYNLLIQFYQKSGNIENTLKYLNKSMKYDNSLSKHLFRIELLKELKYNESVLKYYDTLYGLHYDKLFVFTEKSAFKLDILNKVKEVKKECKMVLDSLNPDKTNGCLGVTYSTIELIKTLARAEYRLNEISESFNHYLMAEELLLNLNYSSALKRIVFQNYDSLILSNPKSGELLLCRSLSKYHKIQNSNKEYKKILMDSILLDLKSSENILKKDYRVHFLRAELSILNKDYKNALSEINSAIELNRSNPRLYVKRAHFNAYSCGKYYPAENDPDYVKYYEFCPKLNKTVSQNTIVKTQTVSTNSNIVQNNESTKDQKKANIKGENDINKNKKNKTIANTNSTAAYIRNFIFAFYVIDTNYISYDSIYEIRFTNDLKQEFKEVKYSSDTVLKWMNKHPNCKFASFKSEKPKFILKILHKATGRKMQLFINLPLEQFISGEVSCIPFFEGDFIINDRSLLTESWQKNHNKYEIDNGGIYQFGHQLTTDALKYFNEYKSEIFTKNVSDKRNIIKHEITYWENGKYLSELKVKKNQNWSKTCYYDNGSKMSYEFGSGYPKTAFNELNQPTSIEKKCWDSNGNEIECNPTKKTNVNSKNDIYTFINLGYVELDSIFNNVNRNNLPISLNFGSSSKLFKEIESVDSVFYSRNRVKNRIVEVKFKNSAYDFIGFIDINPLNLSLDIYELKYSKLSKNLSLKIEEMVIGSTKHYCKIGMYGFKDLWYSKNINFTQSNYYPEIELKDSTFFNLFLRERENKQSLNKIAKLEIFQLKNDDTIPVKIYRTEKTYTTFRNLPGKYLVKASYPNFNDYSEIIDFSSGNPSHFIHMEKEKWQNFNLYFSFIDSVGKPIFWNTLKKHEIKFELYHNTEVIISGNSLLDDENTMIISGRTKNINTEFDLKIFYKSDSMKIANIFNHAHLILKVINGNFMCLGDSSKTDSRFHSNFTTRDGNKINYHRVNSGYCQSAKIINTDNKIKLKRNLIFTLDYKNSQSVFEKYEIDSICNKNDYWEEVSPSGAILSGNYAHGKRIGDWKISNYINKSKIKDTLVKYENGNPILIKDTSLTWYDGTIPVYKLEKCGKQKNYGPNKLYNHRKQIVSDGEFKCGLLYNGKYYIYTPYGELKKILVIKKGLYAGYAQID